MLGGSELPLDTELSLRYLQETQECASDLITARKTDAFLNNMIRSLQGFGVGTKVDRSLTEQVVLVDTVSSIITGWKMMGVANNVSNPLKQKYFYPNNQKKQLRWHAQLKSFDRFAPSSVDARRIDLSTAKMHNGRALGRVWVFPLTFSSGDPSIEE